MYKTSDFRLENKDSKLTCDLQNHDFAVHWHTLESTSMFLQQKEKFNQWRPEKEKIFVHKKLW